MNVRVHIKGAADPGESQVVCLSRVPMIGEHVVTPQGIRSVKKVWHLSRELQSTLLDHEVIAAEVFV